MTLAARPGSGSHWRQAAGIVGLATWMKTCGLGAEGAQRGSQLAWSSSSAFSLRMRTAARRTEQTLIGSYVALRTSTRPASRPRGRCSRTGADPTWPGGVWLPMATDLPQQCSGDRGDAPSGGGIGTEHAHLLAVGVQPGDRVGDRRLVRPALKVGEEQVVAELPAPRARLDLREVHAAEGELRQAAHEPAR